MRGGAQPPTEPPSGRGKEGREVARDIWRAIELLECAQINCDNVKKLGLPMVDIVRMQIDEALKCLEDEEE